MFDDHQKLIALRKSEKELEVKCVECCLDFMVAEKRLPHT